jgi:hypothetical protein
MSPLLEVRKDNNAGISALIKLLKLRELAEIYFHRETARQTNPVNCRFHVRQGLERSGRSGDTRRNTPDGTLVETPWVRTYGEPNLPSHLQAQEIALGQIRHYPPVLRRNNRHRYNT